METSRAVIRGRMERNAWWIVTQKISSQELSNSRFIHLSHDRRELALSLVLHEGDERNACNLLLPDKSHVSERTTVVESDDSLSSVDKDILQI
jgi:hypothetical protein